MTTISKIRTKLQDAQEGIDSSKYTKEMWKSEMKEKDRDLIMQNLVAHGEDFGLYPEHTGKLLKV